MTNSYTSTCKPTVYLTGAIIYKNELVKVYSAIAQMGYNRLFNWDILAQMGYQFQVKLILYLLI